MNKIKNYLVSYIQAQLVVTLISLPILISWGIPLSLMSFVGNLLFLPLITLFLIVSSALFFTELFFIPNGLIAQLLNQITNIFEYLLGFGKKEWLIGFAKPHAAILVIVPLVSLLIIKNVKQPFFRIIFLSTILLATTASLHFLKETTNRQEYYLPQTKDKLLLKHIHGKIELTDNGQFNMKGNPENFVNFELKPYILQNYGNVTIKSLTLLRPGIRSFKGAKALVMALTTEKVILKFNKKKLSKYAWKCFFDLKREAVKNKVQLIRSKINFNRNLSKKICFDLS